MEANEGAQDGNRDGSGDGAATAAGTGTGTGTGVKTPGRTQDGNWDEIEDGNKSNNSGEGNGDEDGNENEDSIGLGRAVERRKPHKTCSRHVGNKGLGWKEEKCRKSTGWSSSYNPDNLENNKEAGVGAQGTQDLSRNCTNRTSVFPLSRLIRYFRNKYGRSRLGRINASGIE